MRCAYKEYRIVLVEPAATSTSFDDNLTRADRPIAVFDTARANAERMMRDVIVTGDAPEVVAAVAVKAANAATPKQRYTAGKVAMQVRFIRRFLHESFMDKTLRKFNKLPA